MPWYDTLPADWIAKLELKTGAAPYVEAIYDPDGLNISLTGSYDLIAMSGLVNERSLDLEWGSRPVIQDITLEFADPDGYFDPENEDSFLHNVYADLNIDHSATATSIKLFPKTGVVFKVGVNVMISDGVNSEEIDVDAFAAAAGSTYYHEITAHSGLVHDYAAGSRVYTKALEGKDVLIRLRMTGCTAHVTLYRGRTIRLPEATSGKAKITISDFKKIIHDKPLIGADSASDKKLMAIDSAGSLATTEVWTGGWGDPPYTWSITSGTLPGGLSLDSSTGEISGTPGETGTFSIDVKVTSAAGESVSATISILIKNYVNEEFLEADGLSSYSLVNSGSISIVSDKCRIAFTDTNKWNDDTVDTGPIYNPVAVFREDISGDWAIMAKFTVNTEPDKSFRIGLAVRNNKAYAGYGTVPAGILFGFYNGLNDMIAWNLHGADEWDGVEYFGTPFWSDTWAGTRTSFELMIKKVANDFFCYRREAGATSWTYCDGSSLTGINAVGWFVTTSENKTISVDVDWMRKFDGTIGFERTSVSDTRVGMNYSCFIEGKGGAGDFSYAVTVGSLPDGLTLNASTGEISGIATTMGTSNFTIEITDGLAATTTQAFSIEVVSEPAILPNILPKAWKSRAFSETLQIDANGIIDFDYITIYDSCRLGEWTVTFSSSTVFTISGPGVLGVEGNTGADLTIPGVMLIEYEAWGGTIIAGHVLTFKTCISWEDENPVQAVFDVLSLKTDLPTNMINASSFFGDKYLGTLAAEKSAGATTLSITVSVPTVIDAGETLIITEGATSEEVTVATGNTVAAGYPPTIALVVSALANSYTVAATVEWKERTALDLSGRYSFDTEYDYAEKCGMRLSLSADREMSIAQIEEVVCAHMDGFTHHDNWGVDRLHTFRPRYNASLTEINGDNAIKAPGAEIETFEIINEIKCQYGYDYINDKYLYGFTYPASDAENKSLWRNEIKRSVTLNLPGFYSEDAAMNIAMRKFFTREDGLRSFVFSTTLKSLLVRIGEQFTLDSDNANFDGEIEIIGMRFAEFLKNVSLQFVGYERNQFSDFALVGEDSVGIKRVW